MIILIKQSKIILRNNFKYLSSFICLIYATYKLRKKCEEYMVKENFQNGNIIKNLKEWKEREFVEI